MKVKVGISKLVTREIYVTSDKKDVRTLMENVGRWISG